VNQPINRTVLTIGHSTHAAARLVELLRRHDVTAVADVRSQPYSRMNPQFNREGLRADLKAAGIEYVFMGRELGARTDDRSCYIDGKVQYDRLARTAVFQGGVERVAQGTAKHRIALMCAEKDPLACHRTILVCRHLVSRGVGVKHILEDGRLESHEDSMARLLSELGIAERDLFRSREDLVDEAYARRGEQIAYVEKVSASEESPWGLAR
jgi:uncharacterized protein (DUF488 family)